MVPKWTIYCHTHIDSGRRYIGLTKQTWQARWSEHVSQALRRKGGWGHFQNAIRKYGKNAFSHEALATCLTVDDANVTEEEVIKQYNTRNPEMGFNVHRGGYVEHPYKENPWLIPGFRERVSASTKAAAARPESKKLRSQTSKTLWSDPKFREKNLTVSIAAHQNPEVRARMSAGMRKRYEDPAERAKSSERWNDPDYRAKCSIGLTNGKNKNKTHCSNGHEFLPETSFVDTQGYRRCDICRQSRNERRRQDRDSSPR